ncbi:MAG: polymerase sigma-70 factor, subfamily, partial [Solirubrobacteraceae bacterium]|nr:polymerase sigma-70 factor, subfamily [Solirubrobacteraceae bacterium]
ASSGDALVREDLCTEAVRLGRLLAELMPDEPEVLGLQALLALHHARRAARLDAGGALVALDVQDRSRWDAAEIAQGTAILHRALRRRRPGPYQVQATIAALHGEATAAQKTDWSQIADLYETLGRMAPSPVVAVNHAVALAFAGRPGDAHAVLAPVLADTRLGGYVALHAAHAELLRRAGEREAALAAYDRAIGCGGNAVERDDLRRRRDALSALDRCGNAR